MKKWIVVLVVFGLCVAALIVWIVPMPANQPRSSNLSTSELTPVLFVHGLGANSEIWKRLQRHFRSLGYPEEYLAAVDLDPPDGSNTRAAELWIAPAVDRLLARAGDHARTSAHGSSPPAKVDIVAHSMGALSSRWFAAKIEPQRVRILITIAGTNHGSNAVCGWDNDGASDLCPAFAKSPDESPIQIALNGLPESPTDETPFGIGEDGNPDIRVAPDPERRILYLTIRIAEDQWITPQHSAILDGAGALQVESVASPSFEETSRGNFLFVGGAGRLFRRVNHDSLLDDPMVAVFVGDILSGSDL